MCNYELKFKVKTRVFTSPLNDEYTFVFVYQKCSIIKMGYSTEAQFSFDLAVTDLVKKVRNSAKKTNLTLL